MKKTRIEQTTKTLPCKLTREETEERNRQLVDAMSDLDAHNDHVDAVKSQLKSQGTAIEARIADLHQICRSGSEPRRVPVEIFADFSAGVAYELRLDTYAESSRPLTESERGKAQISLTEAAKVEDLPPMRVPPPPEDDDDIDSKKGRAAIYTAAREAGWEERPSPRGGCHDYYQGDQPRVVWYRDGVTVTQVDGTDLEFEASESTTDSVVEAIERVRAAFLLAASNAATTEAPPTAVGASPLSPTADAFASIIVETERLRVVAEVDSLEVAQALAARPSLQSGVKKALERVIEDLGLVDACARRDVSTAPRRHVVAGEVGKILDRKRPPVSAGVRRVGEALLARLDVRAAA